jgi:uncharacterized protein YceK
MKRYTLLGIGLSVLLILAGCGSKQSATNATATTTKSTAKTVSFVKQAHAQGTYVWFEVNGVAKDAVVSGIKVLHNGKMQAYQIFDNNVTLGKLSKMSDAAVIKLAKQQDKKYATTGAQSEVQNWLKGNDSQIGQEADFDDDVKEAASGRAEVCYSFKSVGTADSDSEFPSSYTITALNIYKNPDTSSEDRSTVHLYEFAPEGTADTEGGPDGNDMNYGKALLKNISAAKYKSPVARSIKVKNATDASGNKITKQQVTYQSIDYFDGSVLEDNAYKLASQNKTEFLNMVSTSANLSNAQNDADTSLIKKWSPKLVPQYEKLIKPNYDKLMKNVYGYHYWNRDITLSSTISQQIYKHRYIRYYLSDHSTYLVTKAQTSSQKAVLAK